MDPLTIYVGTTRLRFKIARDNVYLSHIRGLLMLQLSDYAFNPRLRKLEVMYRYYRYKKNTEELLVPVNILPMLEAELQNIGLPYELKPDPVINSTRSIDVHMNSNFILREDQKPCVDYMVSELARKGVSLGTGSGKTIMTIAAIVKIGKPALIAVSGLGDQWLRQFQAFTDIGDRIFYVKGIQSLLNLMELETKPAVIIFSLETLRRYVNREENYIDLPSYEYFLSYFEIETKVYDEVHLNFACETVVDLHSNVKNNIYLTATFTSGNAHTRKIFNLIYPKSMIYGEGQRERYIKILSYDYRLGIPDRCYMRMRGYSHTKYESYLLKHPSKLDFFFDSVLIPIINGYYDNCCGKGKRCIIFFATIDMILKAQEILSKYYKHRKVGIYIGESKEEAYNDYEIIISNSKKSGVGTDIKELYVAINTVSYASPTLTEQQPGRLRKLPDGTTPVFIELVNVTCTSHLHHRFARQPIHKRIAAEYAVKSCS